MRRAERRARALAATALAAAALPWFGSALAGRSVLYFRDLVQNLYPWRRFWAEEIRQGRWPLWDPYAASGTPFLANPDNLSLYPLSWLTAALPFDLAFNWTLVLTWLAGMAGAYRLGRRLGAGRPAAVLGALAYGGSGYAVSALNLANVLVVFAAAPWVAWAALGVARRAAARDAAMLGAGVALGLLGGEPLGLGVTLFGSLLLLGLWRWRGGVTQLRRWKTALAGLGLGLLIAAPIVLPAAEMVRRSERGEGIPGGERARWSLGALGLAEFVVPRLEGDPTSFDPRRYWGQSLHYGTMPLLLSLYAGVPLIVLAFVGWRSLPRGARVVTAGGAFLTLGLAAGEALPMFGALAVAGPAAQWVRYPTKLLLGFFGLLCLLAALGLERLRQGADPGRALRLAPLAAAGIAGLALALDHPGGGWVAGWAGKAFGVREEIAVLAARGVRRGLMAALGVSLAAGILLPLGRRLRPGALSGAWILLTCVDLWSAQAHLVPRAPAAALRAPWVFVEHVLPGDRLYREDRPEGFRLRAPDASRLWGFLWDRATLARGTPSEVRVYSVLERPTDRLWPATTARLRRWVLEADPGARGRILRRIGVRWWLTYDERLAPGAREVEVAQGLSDPPLRLRRIEDPLPPIFWTDRFAVAPDEEALHRGLAGPAGDPDVWVEVPEGTPAPALVAGSAALASEPGGGGSSTSGLCVSASSDTGHLELRCQAERPGLAVVLDAWYPGWEVWMDGVRLDSLRVNGAYRGVELPAGRHSVVWRFRPLSVQLGRALGLLGLALSVALASRRPRPLAG